MARFYHLRVLLPSANCNFVKFIIADMDSKMNLEGKKLLGLGFKINDLHDISQTPKTCLLAIYFPFLVDEQQRPA